MNWGKAQIVAQLHKFNPNVVDTGILPEGRYYVVVVFYRDGTSITIR